VSHDLWSHVTPPLRERERKCVFARVRARCNSVLCVVVVWGHYFKYQSVATSGRFMWRINLDHSTTGQYVRWYDGRK